MKEINKKNCDCCGKQIDELKPIGKAGYLLFEDFSENLLLKRIRPGAPYNEEAEKAVEGALNQYADEGYKDPLEYLKSKYGKSKGEELYFSDMAYNQAGASWECRDCIFLDTDEYFEELDRRCSKNEG
ncbi:MAG: hypothetical protein PVJ87_06975 [Desulfobacterales bacterium]|jgi:hypothetical protein